MNKEDSVGCAFPPVHDPKTHESGMSLRDYFAAKALQGLLSDPDTGPEDENLDAFIKDAAVASYQYADAMLEARK